MHGPAPLNATGSDAGARRAPERRNEPPLATLISLGVVAAGWAAYLLILQSHFTFMGDDWEFLLQRRGFSAAVFLNPHNDHIALAPVAIYKALLALFGMTSAFPFEVLSTLVYVLSAVLLFVYSYRCAGGWPALLGSVLILFLGAARTDLLWSFQIGFSGSIAAGIGALLALEQGDRRGDLIACGLLVISTSFSELGVPFVVGALVDVAFGPSPRRRRVYVPLVPLVLYGIWYLGWGHTAQNALSLHNFVNSPKFVFDAISQNLASLLGLATPLSGSANNLVGLTWGRILLVMALAVAAWRLWRFGWPSRRLWVVLAAGGTFWFLTALNANPLLRTPTTGRYQYPGAIFVLLIAAEFLHGIRPRKRVLIATTAVCFAAAVSGAIYLHYGYRQMRASSDALRARLAAVEIGRGHESSNFPVGITIFVAYDARTYLSAADAFGSPAFSESELAASAEANRLAADRVLASAEGINLLPLVPGSHQIAQEAGRCDTFTGGSQPGSAAATLGPGDYTLRARKLPAAAGEVRAPVHLARFADEPLVDLGVVSTRAPKVLDIPRDRSSRPWRLFWPLGSAVKVCELARAKR